MCDGTNGTPDLRDIFVVGAGSTYGIGDTGGENTHILTKAEIPPHTHTFGTANIAGVANMAQRGNNLDANINTGDGSADGLGNQPHENRPPYYALAYIMRL